MRLSEYEQRLLAEMEHALTEDDPRFVRQFAVPPAVAGPRQARGRQRLLHLLRRRGREMPHHATASNKRLASARHLVDSPDSGTELRAMFIVILGSRWPAAPEPSPAW
jgi:DUF3040 family protein